MVVDSRLCRVTVVAPNTRMDVALPEHVRMCDLQPDLLQHAADGPGGEEMLEAGGDAGGWTLARLGGAPLDPKLTPRQLGLVDGEELFLSPIEDTAPEAVFDDVIDAVAVASNSRGRRWEVESSRRFGVACAAAGLGGGAVVTYLTGSLAAMWTGYGLAMGLLLTALLCARALARLTEATVAGLLACAYALVAGMLILADLPTTATVTAPQLMAGGAAVAVAAVAAGIGVPASAPIFSSTALCGIGLCGAAALCVFAGASPAEAGAVAAAFYLGLIPAMPMLAFRVARLHIPPVPRSPQQLRADSHQVDGETALARSERADMHLTGMTTSAAVIAGGAAVALAFDASLPATLLAAMLAVLTFMRARVFITVRQRAPFLLAAGSAAVALAAAAWVDGQPDQRFTTLVVACTFVAVVAFSYVLGVAGKSISPTWGRMVDVFEVLLFVAFVPITLWVWNAYWWVRTING